MALECKQILEKISPAEFDVISFTTGFDLIEFFENFNANDEDDSTKLSHMTSQLFSYIRTSNLRKMNKICENLLLSMSEMGNAEDTLFNFLEETEIDDEAVSMDVNILIECIKKCLIRIPLTNYRHMTWCYYSLLRYINIQVELPTEHNLEGQEKVLNDSDVNVIAIDCLYSKLIDFIEFIFNDIKPNLQITQYSQNCFDDETLQFLLKLFGKPMAYMDIEIHGDNSSSNSFRTYCETMMKYVSLYSSDLLRYLNRADTKTVTIEDVVNYDYVYLPLGVFYYLIFHEGIYFDKIPKVYDSVFIFNCILDHSIVMLETSSNLVQRKGILLCLSCIDRISPYQLNSNGPYVPSLSKFITILCNIMIYSESKENRQVAVKLFKKIIICLDSEMRYIVLLNTPRVSSQSGLIGYITTIIKDIVATYLSTDNKIDQFYFSGKRLGDILKCLTTLTHGAGTDILANYDVIVSVLNFLRYLTLRDKSNVTNIWDFVKWIKTDFLSPLKQALDLSKAHYELELENTSKVQSQTNIEIKVDNQTLPNVPEEDKKDILNTAINTFDLIESLRVRVVECIENAETLNNTEN